MIWLVAEPTSMADALVQIAVIAFMAFVCWLVLR